MDVDKELLSIFDDPIFSDVKPSEIKQTSEDRLVISFEEVNAFFEQYQRLPSVTKGIKEKLLWACLQGILTDESKLTKLLPYDRFELLRPKQALDADDLDEVFNSPLLDGSSVELSILNVPEHLRKKPQIDASEYIAQRKKCENFHLYREGFEKVRQELSAGKRSFVKFYAAQLEGVGNYFLLDGMLLYIAELFEKGRDQKGRLTGRCLCIFDNGTMSDLKLDTLRRALYEDGYAVRENSEDVSRYLAKQFNVEEQDQCTGSIYVLKSLSKDPAICSIEHLYKIGFATTPVQERIANAEHERTYLNAKVELVASWKTYNLTVAKFESLLHQLFYDVRLQVKVDGQIPMEWFVVPYPVIVKAISCIIKEIPISYDRANQAIIEQTTAEGAFQDIIDTTGWKILPLNIKESYFRAIVSGVNKEIHRKLKTSALNKYTFIEDGKRWLKRYDAIRFQVGLHKGSDCVLVEIVDAVYEPNKQEITYTLGKVLF
jgi:hypothetical protein